MRYINEFETTDEYNQAVGEDGKLFNLKHFVARTKDTNKIYLKKENILIIITSNNDTTIFKRNDNEKVILVNGKNKLTDWNYGFYFDGRMKQDQITSFDDSIEWNTNILIGAYEAYYDDNKLQSRSGVESNGDILQASFKSYASERGKGYQLVDWQMHCVLGCLFYAMYGNTNSQAICGKGTNSYSKICGETNSLGMNDTKAETNGNTMSINFWGLENWWGNKYENMEGLETISRDTVKILSPDPSSGRRFTWYSNNDYGKHYRFGKYLDLSRDVTESGSNSTYYCDFNQGPSYTHLTVSRSYSYANALGGVSCAYAHSDSAGTPVSNGSRLAFRGICTKAESVEAFKSLPVL